MVNTFVFVAINKTSFFSYKANREAIHVLGTFHVFFTFFRYKWQYLGIGKELRLQIWYLVTSVQVLSAHLVDFLNRN